MAQGKDSSIVASALWMIVISVVLFFAPAVNGLIGGAVGGYKAGSISRGLAAGILPALVVRGSVGYPGSVQCARPRSLRRRGSRVVGAAVEPGPAAGRCSRRGDRTRTSWSLGLAARYATSSFCSWDHCVLRLACLWPTGHGAGSHALEFDAIRWQGELTGRRFEPTINVVLLAFAKPHGAKMQGQTFLQTFDYDLTTTVRIAAHEMLHPPFSMTGAVETGSLERNRRQSRTVDRSGGSLGTIWLRKSFTRPRPACSSVRSTGCGRSRNDDQVRHAGRQSQPRVALSAALRCQRA